MCGIVYSERKDGQPVSRVIEKRYRKQDHRGMQGFAFVGTENGYLTDVKRDMTEKGILEKLRETLSDRVLFHHRFPTSTVNIPMATHPIVVRNDMLEYDYYVVHNGVISNPTALKTEHEKLGFVYTTDIKKRTVYTDSTGAEFYVSGLNEFNDSEAFAIELALCLEGKKDKIGASGSIAFIAIKAKKDGEAETVYFGRNGGNPLVIEDNSTLFCIKSEGAGVTVPVNTLMYFPAKGERVISSVPFEVGHYYDSTKYPKTEQQRALGFHKQDYGAPYSDYDNGWRYDDEKGLYQDEKIREADYSEADYDAIELQGRIDDLVMDMDILEGEVEALEQDIAKMESNGQDPWQEKEQLKAFYAEMATLESKINSLEVQKYF